MHFIVRSRRAAPLAPGKRFLPHAAVVALLLAGIFAAPAPAQRLPPPGPGVRTPDRLRVETLRPDAPRAEEADAIAGEYVVAFGDASAGPGLYAPSVSTRLAAEAVERSEAAERSIEARRDGSVVLFRYRTAIVGFSARLSDAALAELRRIPGIRVEPNRAIPPPRDGVSSEPEALVRPPEALSRPMLLTASVAAPRGLDRTDRRLLPLDGAFNARFKGKNVHVYVIDTGILASHNEFGGRVRWQEGPGMGHDATNDGQGTKDCGDHGTGVASVIGGKTLGVAPEVIIHPVRVFPCTGTNSSTAAMIAGVDWVAKDRVSALAGSPVVVNISFMAYTSALSTLLDKAVANSVAVGRIPYVIAAGNDNVDACGVSPALVGPAITVGNVKPENDRRMVDSNHGKCVDLFAPGVNIPVAGNGGVGSKGNRSGTSFAAPHVTGVAALFLEKNPTAQPAAIWTAILNAANNNDITPATPKWCGIPNRMTGSPNVLLHWGSGSDNGVSDAPVPPGAPPPSPTC